MGFFYLDRFLSVTSEKAFWSIWSKNPWPCCPSLLILQSDLSLILIDFVSSAKVTILKFFQFFSVRAEDLGGLVECIAFNMGLIWHDSDFNGGEIWLHCLSSGVWLLIVAVFLF